MTDILAKYSFLPWVRQGLGNNIIEADTLGENLPSNAAIERPDVLVDATIKASKGSETTTRDVSKTVKIQGPGDVLGINQKTVIRVHPKKGVTNFETNNLCYIEFYEEDLPWRFSPAKPVGNKLRPWLALIVLRNDEFTRSSSGATPTPFISINSDKLDLVFGDHKDTYALAHVHVLEDLGGSDEASALQAKLAMNPDLALSRVLCPRKLEHRDPDPENPNNNEYHAFLIPAFETGRLAGMGLDTSTTKAQEPSWTQAKINNGTNPVSYPYYYTWSFQVSDGGDFESLAEKLTARVLPENIGKREMDLKDMGFGIEPQGENALSYVEGAMRHPDYATAPWPTQGTDLRNQLKDVLNISADLQDSLPVFSGSPYFYSPALDEDPIISPPTYGKWHQGTNKLTSSGTDWLHDLNLHPTHRAAAGLGTRVVQQNQEQFMEMAWEQIGQINEANQKIIENELSKRVASSLMRKKVAKMSQIDLIATAGQTFNVLKVGESTLKKTLVDSQVPTALRSGAFVKVANNFTPTALMNVDAQAGEKKILSNAFYERVNANDETKISAAPISAIQPSFALSAVSAFQAIAQVLDNQPLTFMQNMALAVKQEGTNFNKNAVIGNLPSEFTTEETARAQAIVDAITKVVSSQEEGVALEVTLYADVFESKISTQFAEGLYEEVMFKKSEITGEPVLFNHQLVIESRVEFKNSFSQNLLKEVEIGGINKLVTPVFKRALRPQLSADISKDIFEKLNPFVTYGLKLAAWLAADQANKNKPIMAYPRFPIPTYDYLKGISADYIIPNISEIEPDTITLMEPNKQFIESFLAGMNHEFSRELLWREFPTDMRGSYFRHFWEYNNNPNMEIQPLETVEDYTQRVLETQDNAADINEMHKWKTNDLGNNHNGGPQLVLLIKGDIFKKYPGTLVYAQKAVFDPDDKTEPRLLDVYDASDEDKVKWPIITGNIEPDVYFFGFDLSEEEANGNRNDFTKQQLNNGAQANPGWFFVLRERPGQISFGLDDLGNDPLDTTPNSWNDVTWENITQNANVQPPYLKVKAANIQLDANSSAPNNATWGASSSDMAYILYQAPVLFARHASTMLND